MRGGKRNPSLQLARRLAEALAAWMAAALATTQPEAPGTADAGPALAPPRSPTPSAELPTYFTPFVGRERAQAELQALLARPDCRLITLLGPGGVGKTRLAIEAVRRLDVFSDGVAFISLTVSGATAPTSSSRSRRRSCTSPISAAEAGRSRRPSRRPLREKA